MSQEIKWCTGPGDLDPRKVLENVLADHGEKWVRFVERMLSSHADAQDVLQEAVRRLLMTERSFESEDQVRMYLARAIGNTAIEYYHARRRSRLRQLPLQDDLLACAETPNPEDCLIREETALEHRRILALLDQGLARLPAKQYEALRLTVLDAGAISIREAGIENGIPYSTLRHRNLQGIRRLRHYVHRALARFSHQVP